MNDAVARDSTPKELRQIFVLQLRWNRPKNAQELWDKFKAAMSADMPSVAATVDDIDTQLRGIGWGHTSLSTYVSRI